MPRLRWLSALVILPLSLSSCSQISNTPPTLASLNTLNSSILESYNFEVSAGFQLASVDDSDKDLIEQVKQKFASDLKAGLTDDYQRDKDFTIHLLSGSEGNYFTSPEFLQNSLQSVLATLVVMDANNQAEIFKGQFDNQRFVFADPSEQFDLTERTKAYLLTAGSNFDIQTYKGELVPDSELESQDQPATAAVPSSQTTTAAPVAELGYVEFEDYGYAYPATSHLSRAYPARPYNGVASGGVSTPALYPAPGPVVNAWGGMMPIKAHPSEPEKIYNGVRTGTLSQPVVTQPRAVTYPAYPRAASTGLYPGQPPEPFKASIDPFANNFSGTYENFSMGPVAQVKGQSTRRPEPKIIKAERRARGLSAYPQP